MICTLKTESADAADGPPGKPGDDMSRPRNGSLQTAGSKKNRLITDKPETGNW